MIRPLLLIAAGVALAYLAGGLVGRPVRRSWLAAGLRDRDRPEEDRLAWVRANPLAWVMPPLSFLSLGLVAAGLVWLVIALVA